jgi:hypothetical protein
MKGIDLFLALGVFVLSFCSQSIQEGQGVRGTVLLGPNCPVVQADEPCPDTPFQTELVVTTADGINVVKQFSSNSNGEFEVNLAVGTYAIRSPNPGGLPYCSTNEPFTVTAGTMIEANIFCDTGIR